MKSEKERQGFHQIVQSEINLSYFKFIHHLHNSSTCSNFLLNPTVQDILNRKDEQYNGSCSCREVLR